MKGRRPIDVMLGDDWFPMSQVRRHLEAEVAGYQYNPQCLSIRMQVKGQK